MRHHQLPAGSPGQKPPITSLNANGRDAELRQYRDRLFIDFPVRPFEKDPCCRIVRSRDAISILDVNRLSFEEPFGPLGSTVDKDRSRLSQWSCRKSSGEALNEERIATVVVVDPDDVEYGILTHGAISASGVTGG